MFIFIYFADAAGTWRSLAKLLSRNYITTGYIHAQILENFSEEIKCHNKPPLYLLPSSDLNSHRLLYEVNNMRQDVYNQTSLQRHTCPSTTNPYCR
jgi:hypothetical protein